jgi:hypothetical protein
MTENEEPAGWWVIELPDTLPNESVWRVIPWYYMPWRSSHTGRIVYAAQTEADAREWVAEAGIIEG